MSHVSLCGSEVASKFPPQADVTHTAVMNYLTDIHSHTHTHTQAHLPVCRLRFEPHSKPSCCLLVSMFKHLHKKHRSASKSATFKDSKWLIQPITSL